MGLFGMKRLKDHAAHTNEKPFEEFSNNAMMQDNDNDDRGDSNNESKSNISQDKGKQVESSDAPFVPYEALNKLYPGIDPTDLFPKRINPGPGFNVPGGEVPIRDEICKHIDYNTYVY